MTSHMSSPARYRRALITALVAGLGSTGRAQAPAPSALLRQLAAELPSRRSRDAFDISVATVEARAERARSILQRAGAIDEAALTHDEALTLAVLRWEAARDTLEPRLYWFRSSLPAYSTPLRTQALSAVVFRGDDDLAAYLRQLRRYPPLLAAMLEKERARAERGIVLPRAQLERVAPFIRSFARPPAQSPFGVAEERLAAIPAERAAAFRAEVTRLITDSVTPAVERLARFVESELGPRAPLDVGMGQYPGGREAYAVLARLETTLDLTPEEVFRVGLAGTDSTEALMRAVRDSLGFTGTKAEFHAALRRDPRFYARTPDEVRERMLRYVARVEPLIPRHFLRVPKAPYAVRRMDPLREDLSTFGSYTPPQGADPRGYYNFNGSNLGQRPLIGVAGLILHELVPGHHFQVNLIRENDSLPDLRRYGAYLGNGEGWAEYAGVTLARDAGIYADPYEGYGRLLGENFLNARLVTDVGMNVLGWSRERAMAFMREHTLASDLEIESETLRYAADIPARALAYGTGYRAWLDLRRKAERELGPRFDARRFHDAALSAGMVPLSVLERHVDWWIAQEKARSP
jgi:uncharacterized protein (DUF885 family)